MSPYGAPAHGPRRHAARPQRHGARRDASAARTGAARQHARYLAELDRGGGRQGFVDRALRLAVRAGFALVGWRVRVEGLERLPRDRDGRVVPCVVAAAPHRGWPDPFLVLVAWPGDAPRLAWFGDEATMTRSWWRRRVLPRVGMIPIPADPSVAAVEVHLDAARRVLGRGRALVVFPEKGPPSPRGRTRTIAPGAAWLALAGGVPIVPVALAGFRETGLGTRFGVRYLAPVGPEGPRAGTSHSRAGAGPAPVAAADAGRRGLSREGRALTAELAAALSDPVASLEARSLRENGRRPLPGLRRLFR